MKRLWKLFALLSLLFLPGSPGRAQGLCPNTFFAADAQGSQEDCVISTATDGEGLFMLSALRLYEYAPGMRDKRLCVDWDEVFAGLNRGQPRQELLDAFSRTRVDRLVSGEGAVYALSTQTGALSRWDGERLQPWAQVDALAGELSASAGRVFLKNQVLYYLVPGEDGEAEDALCCYDLKTGTVERVGAGRVLALCDYRAGDLACLRGLGDGDEMGCEIARFDARTKRFVPLRTFQDREIGALGFSRESQRLLFVEAGVVWQLDGAGGVLPAGRLPVGASGPDWALYAFAGGDCALVTPQGIHVRPLSGVEDGQNALSVCLKNTDAVPGFAQAYPDVDLHVAQYMDAAALAQGLIDGSLDADVLEIDAALLPALIDKGYAAELSADAALVADSEALYPALREAVTRGDGLFAVPAQMTVRSWLYDPEAWAACVAAPPPRTVGAYIDLCAGWLARDERASGDFSLRYPGQSLTGQMLLDVFNLYVDQYDRDGAAFTFDNEVLRDALQRVSSLKERYAERDGDSGTAAFPILRTDNTACFGEDRRGALLLPPVFEAERPPVVCADLTVYVVRAGSDRQALALKFLEYAARNRSAANLRMLMPARKEPVERPNFAKEKAALIDNLAVLYEARERAEGDAAAQIQATIDLQEHLLDTAEERRWAISAEEIAAYRDIAQYLTVRATPFSAIQRGSSGSLFYDLLAQYEQGKLGLDALIARMEEKRRMIEWEMAL